MAKGMAQNAKRARSRGGGKRWIQGAIKRPGALRKKAMAAGMSTMAFARKHKGAAGRLGRQSRLALTLRRFHR